MAAGAKEAAARVEAVASRNEIRRALGVAEEQRAKAVAAVAKEAAAKAEAVASRNAAQAETARTLLSETRGLHCPATRLAPRSDDNLRRLASTKVGRPDTGRLRDEAVACVAGLDARERPRMTPAAPSNQHGLRYSSDGKLLATNDLASHRICLWDAERSALTRAIPAADHGPVSWTAFGFHRGGSSLAYADPGRGVSYLSLDKRITSPPPPRIAPEGADSL